MNGTMNQFDGEMAAIRHQRKMESLGESTVSVGLSKIADVANEFGVPGAGLFAKALKSGQTPVEMVVEQIESGAYEEITRIWRHLQGQYAKQKEFEARLQNQDARAAYLNAVLHGLRTSDPKKQFRLGVLTVNCVYVGDLKPESLDDMLRPAVELRELDLILLKDMYVMAKRPDAKGMLSGKEDRTNLFSIWQDYWHRFPVEYPEIERRALIGGFGRLSAFGFIFGTEATSMAVSPVAMNYWITEEGERFYERLQEVVEE